MLSSFLTATLKQFKTTSPQKLFQSDCITLYNYIRLFPRTEMKKWTTCEQSGSSTPGKGLNQRIYHNSSLKDNVSKICQ